MAYFRQIVGCARKSFPKNRYKQKRKISQDQNNMACLGRSVWSVCSVSRGPPADWEMWKIGGKLKVIASIEGPTYRKNPATSWIGQGCWAAQPFPACSSHWIIQSSHYRVLTSQRPHCMRLEGYTRLILEDSNFQPGWHGIQASCW